MKTKKGAPVLSGVRPTVVDYRKVQGDVDVPLPVPPSSAAVDGVDAMAARKKEARVGDDDVSKRFEKMEQAQESMQLALGQILQALGGDSGPHRSKRRSLSV